MKSQLFLVSIIAIVLFGFASISFGTTVSFQGLGSGSTAIAVSADGSVVVGRSHNQAFRWTAETGVVGLGSLVANYANTARAVSADGSVVVGSNVVPDGVEAFRWTESQGMVGLGYLPAAATMRDSRAYGVSADGSVIVGWGKAASGYYKAFYWTESLGMQDLLSGSLTSYAKAVSADGSVVVGHSDGQAFRWTASDGMVGLGNLPGGDRSAADGVSANGAVVVGYSTSVLGHEAFRWTAETGMVGLGDLPGGQFYSSSEAVSADGSVVVGWSVTDGNVSPVDVWTEEAFIWDPSNGMRNLKDVLENDHGFDLTGWILSKATGISDDGLTIVGSGINPNGHSEGWIATIPEPAKTYYANASDGSDDNDGLSPNTAFATIQKAIDTANDGDTVIVGPGIHEGEGNYDIDFKGKAITVRGANPNDPCIVALTIINGSTINDKKYHNGFVFQSNEDANSILLGLSITGFTSHRCTGILIEGACPSIQKCKIFGNYAGITTESDRRRFPNQNEYRTVISDSNISDNAGPGISMGGNMTILSCLIERNRRGGIATRRGCGWGPRDPVIQNCRIAYNNYIGLDLRDCYGSALVKNCSIIGNRGDNGGGICSSCYLTIENSVIAGNYSSYKGGAIVFYDPLTVRNCTIVGNFAECGYALSCNNYVSANIENSIIRSNHPDSTIRFRGNYNNYIDFSNVEGGINSIQLDSGAILNWGPGNIDADPCFIEPGYWADANDPNIIVEPNDSNAIWIEGDYHLLRTSPCIDAGTDTGVYTDIEGNSRPFDFPGVDNNGELPDFDMGAYETTAQQARLWILPRVINRKSNQPRIMAWLRLPQGITKDQIDRDVPLILYPGGIKAVRQFVIQNRRRGDNRTSVLAFFNKAELMDAIDTNGPVQLQVFGHLLEPGQYFYGSDTVRITARRLPR